MLLIGDVTDAGCWSLSDFLSNPVGRFAQASFMKVAEIRTVRSFFGSTLGGGEKPMPVPAAAVTTTV